jgi:hypothetical protein
MESRGHTAAARIDEIGDGSVFRPALACDRSGEDPGMAIGDQPLFSGLERQDTAVPGFEVVHGRIVRRYASAVNEQQTFWIIIGLFVVLAVVLIAIIARKSAALSERLERLTTSFGWEAPRRIWWTRAIRARWRGVDVELRHMGRYKSVPERLLLTVKAASPARVIVKRRVLGFLSKPITMFGPPLVEPTNLPDRERFWVRSNELVLVERLVSYAEVPTALETNLIARFDIVDLQPKQLRILRAVDDRAVKKKFNRPFIKFGRDYELIDTIATEEWKLGVLIVEKLGLRGYEVG